MNTDPDISALRSVAADYDVAGPQYANLAALMRRVATKLEAAYAPPGPGTAPVRADCDGGAVGGLYGDQPRMCPVCEE